MQKYWIQYRFSVVFMTNIKQVVLPLVWLNNLEKTLPIHLEPLSAKSVVLFTLLGQSWGTSCDVSNESRIRRMLWRFRSEAMTFCTGHHFVPIYDGTQFQENYGINYVPNCCVCNG